MNGKFCIKRSYDNFPLKDFTNKLSAKVLEDPGGPVRKRGILLSMQTNITNKFSFKE
jgi:hypothetical protein